jgi:2-isopropylmalate synthase
MIRILDSTLREGEQTPGVYFSPASKLEIARLLDQIGVDVIEAGNPAVGPQIAEGVTAIARAGLRARIGAHARCRIDDVEKALACGPGFLGVFLSLSERRLQRDYQLTQVQALDRIGSVVSFARAAKAELQIRFTIEDAVRTPLAAVIAAAQTAVGAGANIIGLADTTGFATPFTKERSLGRLVRRVKQELALQNLEPEIEVHCHNDRGLALANALDAYRAGVNIIDATVLGLGERVGIVDLAELLVNLRETFGEGAHWNLDLLGSLAELVSTRAGVTIPANRPILGEHAFTHTAGIHVKAVAKDAMSYQSLKPEQFGRNPRFVLGVQSGSASVEVALKAIGRENLSADKELVSKLLAEVKMLAVEGVTVTLENEFPAIVNRLARH